MKKETISQLSIIFCFDSFTNEWAQRKVAHTVIWLASENHFRRDCIQTIAVTMQHCTGKKERTLRERESICVGRLAWMRCWVQFCLFQLCVRSLTVASERGSWQALCSFSTFTFYLKCGEKNKYCVKISSLTLFFSL